MKRRNLDDVPIHINPLEVSDEEFLQHKREVHARYEQWFRDLCQEIWDEYFASMFTTKGEEK